VPLSADTVDKDSIKAWLLEDGQLNLNNLWRSADDLRRKCVGDEVWLRGLIEISNHCARSCAYCGISALVPKLKRYRMSQAEILAAARKALAFGFGTVVLQSGEDPMLTGPLVADVLRAIKQETGLAITLSLGERSDEELQSWREAGADRYLLRFETSDKKLYSLIHPNLHEPSDRLSQLKRMKGMGYEIGTGVMVGIPGQTWDTLANDILQFREYGIDMVGIGPFIESPGTPLAGELGAELRRGARSNQVPSDNLTTLKAVALTRLVCPYANIPATTALATIDPSDGRSHALQRGANVVMPNLTPPEYRTLYQIYPGKEGLYEAGDMSRQMIETQINSFGRRVGRGPGGSRASTSVGFGYSR
jgi:biotin synthase